MELPSTLVFDYPTMSDIAAFLTTKVPATGAEGGELEAEVEQGLVCEPSWSADEAAGAAPLATQVAAQRALTAVTIAVTGMVLRSPANAFAHIEPKDAVTLVPASRWDLDSHAGGTATEYSQAACLHGIPSHLLKHASGCRIVPAKWPSD